MNKIANGAFVHASSVVEDSVLDHNAFVTSEMRVLMMSPYYWPEKISSTHLSNDLYEAYCAAGFTIENYVPTPIRGVSKEVRTKYKKIKYEEQADGKIGRKYKPLSFNHSVNC